MSNVSIRHPDLVKRVLTLALFALMSGSMTACVDDGGIAPEYPKHYQVFQSVPSRVLFADPDSSTEIFELLIDLHADGTFEQVATYRTTYTSGASTRVSRDTLVWTYKIVEDDFIVTRPQPDASGSLSDTTDWSGSRFTYIRRWRFGTAPIQVRELTAAEFFIGR